MIKIRQSAVSTWASGRVQTGRHDQQHGEGHQQAGIGRAGGPGEEHRTPPPRTPMADEHELRLVGEGDADQHADAAADQGADDPLNAPLMSEAPASSLLT